MTYNLRKLQLVQLDILKDVANFCDHRNIVYYLFGGTLLGAVRHRGFIPWDDDVDIAMYRDDYDRFIEAFTGEYRDKYFVQNNHTDKGYSRNCTKVRLNGTRQIERDYAGIDMHHGIYIDIFPLDHVPEYGGVCLRLRGGFIRLLAALANLRAGKRDHKSKTKDMLKRSLHVFAPIIPGTAINRLYDYVCTMSNNKECKYTTCFPCGYGWKKQLVSNDVYSKGIKVEFEGCAFTIPEKYDVLLKQLYGDFMKLPPAGKQVSGHVLELVDFGEYGRKPE